MPARALDSYAPPRDTAHAAPPDLRGTRRGHRVDGRLQQRLADPDATAADAVGAGGGGGAFARDDEAVSREAVPDRS
jgi:hypothetical protein